MMKSARLGIFRPREQRGRRNEVGAGVLPLVGKSLGRSRLGTKTDVRASAEAQERRLSCLLSVFRGLFTA